METVHYHMIIASLYKFMNMMGYGGMCFFFGAPYSIYMEGYSKQKGGTSDANAKMMGGISFKKMFERPAKRSPKRRVSNGYLDHLW